MYHYDEEHLIRESTKRRGGNQGVMACSRSGLSELRSNSLRAISLLTLADGGFLGDVQPRRGRHGCQLELGTYDSYARVS